MSTVVAREAKTVAVEEPSSLLDRCIEYTPLGEEQSLALKYGDVDQFITVHTKSGARAGKRDIIKFMMLCRARRLNPWAGDAFLVGYDGKRGPEFSIIVSHSALLKRADLSPAYDGMKSGVTVARGDTVEHREGDLVYPGESLIGAWAEVYRTDRSHPSRDVLDRKTYDKGRSQWSKDPAGMIVKCAESSALRKAFPSETGGLYTEGDVAIERSQSIDQRSTMGDNSIAGQSRDLSAAITSTVVEPPAEDAEPRPEFIEMAQAAIAAATSTKAINDAETALRKDAICDVEHLEIEAIADARKESITNE